MSASRKRKRERPAASADGALELPSGALAEALDEVRATVIALLASLREKERELRQHGGAHPAPGVLAGLSDVAAIRVWADRTLRTLGVLAAGGSGELAHLLEELGEFRDLVDRPPADLPG